MKFGIFAMLIASISLFSCSTKQFVFQFSEGGLDKTAEFVIVRNDTSLIIPVGVYPDQKYIERFVVRMRSAIVPIDSLIYSELKNRGLSAHIVDKKTPLQTGINYITYQDYWAWDFKKYMHVLKIRFYSAKNGEKIMEVVSQGDKAGVHDYPNPKKQVPLLIEKALNHQ